MRDQPGEQPSGSPASEPTGPSPAGGSGVDPAGGAGGVRGELRRLNVPNLLTFLRVLLVPVILWLLLVDTPDARWWAFGVFALAAATDSVDGWVARRWDGVTRWGQLADPIADKLLVGGALASLAVVGDLPWWAVVVIVVREVAVTLLRLHLVHRRQVVMPASRWGKAKTLSQVLAIGLYLWPDLSAAVRDGLLYLAVALTVWSGMDYARRAGRVAADAAEPTPPR